MTDRPKSDSGRYCVLCGRGLFFNKHARGWYHLHEMNRRRFRCLSLLRWLNGGRWREGGLPWWLRSRIRFWRLIPEVYP